MTKTHWRTVDYRISSLYQIIAGLNNAITILKNRMKELEWYDAMFFYEESEPIYGLALVSFQNYINGSIMDLFPDTEQKSKYYKLDSIHQGYDISAVELIIGLANYFKHKDDGKPHGGTQKILDGFNLKVTDEITESPIFEGITILNEEWDLFAILEIVKDWRAKLFSELEAQYINN